MIITAVAVAIAVIGVVYAGMWIATGFIYIITRFEKKDYMRDFNKHWIESAIYMLTFGMVGK